MIGAAKYIGGSLGLGLAGSVAGGLWGGVKGARRGTEDQPQGGFFGGASGIGEGAIRGFAIGAGAGMIPGLRSGVRAGWKTAGKEAKAYTKGKDSMFANGSQAGDKVAEALSNRWAKDKLSTPGYAVGGAIGGGVRSLAFGVGRVKNGLGDWRNKIKANNAALRANNPAYAEAARASKPINAIPATLLGLGAGGAMIGGAVVGTASFSGQGHPYNAIQSRRNRSANSKNEFMMRQSKLAQQDRMVMSNPYIAGMRDVNEAYSYSRSNRSSALPTTAGHARVAGPNRRWDHTRSGADGELVFALNDLRRG